MNLNELYYRYKAAEDSLRRAQNYNSRRNARAALTRAFHALGNALNVPYRNNMTLRRMSRNERRPENHGFRNNVRERNIKAAIKELDNRYKAAMISVMRGLPNGPQGNILRSVLRR
jgi:hypothetical protein